MPTASFLWRQLAVEREQFVQTKYLPQDITAKFNFYHDFLYMSKSNLACLKTKYKLIFEMLHLQKEVIQTWEV